VGFHWGALIFRREENKLSKKESPMFQTPAVQRMQLVIALAHIRRERQDVTCGKSLLKWKATWGMLLADLINNIG
jgi:hypothetical protein